MLPEVETRYKEVPHREVDESLRRKWLTHAYGGEEMGQERIPHADLVWRDIVHVERVEVTCDCEQRGVAVRSNDFERYARSQEKHGTHVPIGRNLAACNPGLGYTRSNASRTSPIPVLF